MISNIKQVDAVVAPTAVDAAEVVPMSELKIDVSQIGQYLNDEMMWTYMVGPGTGRIPKLVCPVEIDGDEVTALVNDTGKIKVFKLAKIVDITVRRRVTAGPPEQVLRSDPCKIAYPIPVQYHIQ